MDLSGTTPHGSLPGPGGAPPTGERHESGFTNIQKSSGPGRLWRLPAGKGRSSLLPFRMFFCRTSMRWVVSSVRRLLISAFNTFFILINGLY